MLTCVCPEVSLEVGALEVSLPAARKVAYIVPPAGEVQLGGRGGHGTAGPRGHVDRGRGQRQQLGVAEGHDVLRAVLGLGNGRLGGQHQHHRSLRHRRAHEEGLMLAERRALGEDGCGAGGL